MPAWVLIVVGVACVVFAAVLAFALCRAAALGDKHNP